MPVAPDRLGWESAHPQAPPLRSSARRYDERSHGDPCKWPTECLSPVASALSRSNNSGHLLREQTPRTTTFPWHHRSPPSKSTPRALARTSDADSHPTTTALPPGLCARAACSAASRLAFARRRSRLLAKPPSPILRRNRFI